MSIFLVRHGETASNVSRVVQTPGTSLNQRGAAQATLLARRLDGEPIDRLLSSDLRRALMTAELVSAAIGRSVEAFPVLQERNFGDLRGRRYDAIGFDIMVPGYEPPGGESWEQFHDRVDDAWRFVVQEAERVSGAVVVVTHGLVCHSLAARHLRMPNGVEAPMRWGNTSVTVISKQPPWQVSTMNCTTHLRGDFGDDVDSLSGM